MASLLCSSLLQSLGYAIVHSLWQFALLWLLYFLVNIVFKLSPHQKYVSAAVAQLAGFSWFITSFFWVKKNAGMISLFTEPGGSKTPFFIADGWIKMAESIMPFVAVVYLCVLFFLLAKWIRAYRCVKHLRSEGLVKANVEWRLFVQKIAAQMGIKKQVGVYFSHLVQSPLTVGFWKPVILMPLACMNHLSVSQMEAVLLHELAHIKRYDYLLHLLLSLTEAVLFFNPFMHLLSRQIKMEREHCCDDWVLQYDYDKTMYAHTLLQIATAATCPALALYAVSDNKLLLDRIKRMVVQEHKSRAWKLKSFLPALVVMICFVGWVFSIPAQKQKVTNVIHLSFNKNEQPQLSKNLFYVNEKQEKSTVAENGFVAKEAVIKNSSVSHVLRKLKNDEVLFTDTDENIQQHDLLTQVSNVTATYREDRMKDLQAMVLAIAEQINEHRNELSANDLLALKTQMMGLLQQQVALQQAQSLVSNNNLGRNIPAVYMIPPSAEQLKALAEQQRLRNDSLPERIIIIELPETIADTIIQHLPAKVKVLKTTRL